MLTFKLTKDQYWQVALLFCLIAAVMMLPSFSYGSSSYTDYSTDDGISQTLCFIVTMLTGPVGKTTAMIALVVLGIGIFLGKLSWQLALGVAVGITFIFAAGKIINWLSGTGTDSCSVATS